MKNLVYHLINITTFAISVILLSIILKLGVGLIAGVAGLVYTKYLAHLIVILACFILGFIALNISAVAFICLRK
jgi:hypothetical protein